MQVQIQKQKAITLIALAITIIVLLILVGVTIVALEGNDGLIVKVEKAKTEQMKAKAKENINMAIIQIQTREVPKGTEVTLQILNDNLNAVDNRIQPKDYTAGNTELEGTYTADKNTKFNFIIDEKLNVEIEEAEGGTITFGATTWTDGKAGVTISTNEASLYIEYQVNGTTGTWTKGTGLGANVIVSGLNNGDTIYARLTDGTYSGKYEKLTVADTTEPEVFTIKVSNSSETSIKIEGSTTDTESGIKDYTYVVKTSDGTVVNTKEHTTDTIYEVTGLTTGTYYIVYMVAYDNVENETKSDEKKIRVQEALNYAPLGVVAYDAGKWTETEIQSLQEAGLYNLNASKTASKTADLNFTFGGFTYKGDTINTSYINSGKIITSRNQSVAPQSNFGTPTYDGWQILSSYEENGKTYVTKLVHAGSPENFVYYKTTTTDGYRVEYILSSGLRQPTYNTYSPRSWQLYVDKDQKDLIADTKDKDENTVKDIHAMTYDEANSASSTIRKTGAYYWLGSAINSIRFWCVKDSGDIDTEFGWCWGIRPVVSLKPGVYAKSGNGTPEDPFVLGIDN